MKKPLQPDYKFYPSLLDAYRWYQQSESDTAEQELIDKINRVPFKSEAADKGTWLNDLIDLSLKGERFGLNYLTGVAADIYYRLKGSARQVYTSMTTEVDGNIVEIYGYIDYVKEDSVIDLKTTASYELGKYKNSLQLHFYPVSLINEGNEINKFEFLVTDFQNIYSEVYMVNYHTSLYILHEACRELIRFLELRKDLITDKKIFNQLQAA
jgi:hypothetical protein